MGSSSSSYSESKENDDDQMEVEAEVIVKSLDTNLDEINDSLFEDASISNVINNFSKALLPPELRSVTGYIEIMKQNWLKIMGIMVELRGLVGDEEADDLVALKNDYWRLLLKTRRVIKILMESSKNQKQNIDMLLALMNTFKTNKHKFNYQQQLQYNECMNHLSEWIDQKALTDILSDWERIIQRLQKKQKSWEQFKKKALKGAICAALGCLAVAVVIGVVVVVCVGISVATGGTAAAGAVPVIKTVTIYGVAIAKTHFVTAVTGLTVAAALAFCAIKGTEKYCTWKVLTKARNIQNGLKEMLKTSLNVEQHMKELVDTTEMIRVDLNYLKNKTSFENMKNGLKNMREHLIEYHCQGGEVLVAIQEASKVMIDI